jgi:hypothetical protein
MITLAGTERCSNLYSSTRKYVAATPRPHEIPAIVKPMDSPRNRFTVRRPRVCALLRAQVTQEAVVVVQVRRGS